MNYITYKPETGEVISTGMSSQEVVPLYDDLQYITCTTEELQMIDKPSKWRVMGLERVLAPAEDPVLLEFARADKWQVIKRERAAHEFGAFTWDGSIFDGDAASQYRLSTAAQLAAATGEGFSVTWTLFDNTTRQLGAADLMSIVGTLAGQIAAYYERARLLRERIDTAATAEELAAISWDMNLDGTPVL
jgi:hypothetical protein